MRRHSAVTSGAGVERPKPEPPPAETTEPDPPADAWVPPPPPRTTRPAVQLPPKAWRLISVLGLFVAVTFAVLPVGATFGDDPLLRLRDLNPELSPPAPTAVCGSAIKSRNVQPKDTSLFEVARARACQQAARRRVYGAVAVGAILVVVGFLGKRGGIPSPARLRPKSSGG